MQTKKLTKSQINNLPAQYTFVNGKMVRKSEIAAKVQATVNEWDYVGDAGATNGECDDDMLFATAKR